MDNYEDISHISFDGYLSHDMISHTGQLLIQELHKTQVIDDIKIFHMPREHYTCHSADSNMNKEMDELLDQIFDIKPKVSQLQRLRNSKGRR